MLLSADCKKAVFNHITEGAGGVLIGFSNHAAGNKILVSGNPETLNEGEEVKISVKISQAISQNMIVTVETANSEILINGSSKSTLSFTPETASVDQSITLQSVPDNNKTSETVKIILSAPNMDSSTVTININDTMTRNIILSGQASVNEEATGILNVSLGIKPNEQVTVSLTSSEPSVTIQNPNITLTPTNYSTVQNVNYTINDSYNIAKAYTITASIDSESKSYSVTVNDNDFQYFDLSAGQTANTGYNPSIAIDAANGYIYVATRNLSNSSRLSLFRCSLNGTNCVYLDASAGQGANSAHFPKLVIDSASSNLLVVTADRSVNVDLSLFICPIALTPCSNVAIAGGANIGFDPKIIINSALSKIHLMGISSSNLFFITCNLNGTGCTSNDMGVYAAGFGSGYQSRGVAFDSATNKIFSVNTGGVDATSFFIPIFKKFDAVATNLQTATISLQARLGMGPDLKLYSVNSKVSVVASNWSLDGRPWLFRCDLNGLNCESKDISTSKPFPSYYPSLNIDTVNQKLIVIAVDNNTYTPNLFRCDLNGDNCKNTDISLGKQVPIDSYQYHYDSAIDYTNNRLLVVFTEKSTGKLGLIRFGLQGF